MRFLRQSTVATIKLGPFVGTDGITPYTAGGFVAKVGANGGALAARHDATSIAHDADGFYGCELDATDVATVGRLRVEVPGSAGNYLPVWEDFTVLSQAVYDSLFGSAALSTGAGGTVTLGTLTVTGTPTTTQIQGTSGNLGTVSGLYTGRKLYFDTSTGEPFLLTGECTHAYSGGTHTFTFAAANNGAPAAGDVGKVI